MSGGFLSSRVGPLLLFRWNQSDEVENQQARNLNSARARALAVVGRRKSVRLNRIAQLLICRVPVRRPASCSVWVYSIVVSRLACLAAFWASTGVALGLLAPGHIQAPEDMHYEALMVDTHSFCRWTEYITPQMSVI